MTQAKTSLLRIFLIYLRLGCLCFGGPVAHMGYFKDEFVNRRKWLSDTRYAELLGLCQFVPGPSSSQLGFAIGWQRGGLPGACAAWLGFTLPSAILMICFAYGLLALGEQAPPIVHGLLIAAVAVVANAILGLGQKLCPDRSRLLIAILSASLAFSIPSSLTQIAVICLGAFLGNAYFRQYRSAQGQVEATKPMASRTTVCIALLLYACLLSLSLWFNASDLGAIFALHYRAGALVFGGGHVLLPLLHNSLIPTGLVTEDNFLAGYSAAQALPGPLFTFSAFLGTKASPFNPAWLGGIGALFAIFLPGMLLLVGLLPLWNKLRHRTWARASLTGANAAVVGLLLAAFVHPVWSHGIHGWLDFSIATAAFFALYLYKSPAWLVVLSCAAASFSLGLG